MPDDIETNAYLFNNNSTNKTLTKADKKKMDKEMEEAEKEMKKKRKKYKLYMPKKKNLYPFIACDGPCSFDVNLGAQVFHCSHEEFKKGIMA
mmetsp:Transcript_18005/g.15931  ORF Transcript_18005/g.15931 Transcript_18005/m.15931 type:complete len:92 (+) Transcript_18005:963-1238(+)